MLTPGLFLARCAHTSLVEGPRGKVALDILVGCSGRCGHRLEVLDNRRHLSLSHHIESDDTIVLGNADQVELVGGAVPGAQAGERLIVDHDIA